MRGALLGLVLLVAGAVTAEARPARTPAARAGPAAVIAFTGWIPVFFTMNDSAIVTIVAELRSRGIAAEAHDPAHWAAVAERLVAAPPAGPVVLVGYSMGAGAVTQFAARLGEAGIPVRSAILLEAWNPQPVPANVADAVHYAVSGYATPISPGPGFRGSLRNVDLRTRVPGIENYDHVALSKLQAVQDLIVGDILRAAGRGRRR